MSVSLQWGKINNPQLPTPASIDLDELTIQINQIKALNTWPEGLQTSPYQACPLSTHLTQCLIRSYHSRHFDRNNHGEWTDCSTTKLSIISSLNGAPLDWIETAIATDTWSIQHSDPSLSHQHHNHCDTAGAIGAHSSRPPTLESHYTSQDAAHSTAHPSSSCSELFESIRLCVDHTQPLQGELTLSDADSTPPNEGELAHTAIEVESIVITGFTPNSRH